MRCLGKFTHTSGAAHQLGQLLGYFWRLQYLLLTPALSELRVRVIRRVLVILGGFRERQNATKAYARINLPHLCLPDDQCWHHTYRNILERR